MTAKLKWICLECGKRYRALPRVRDEFGKLHVEARCMVPVWESNGFMEVCDGKLIPNGYGPKELEAYVREIRK